MLTKTFDTRGLIEQGRINKVLEKKGFSKLHEEGLLDQMAVCVRNHEHFRKILVKLDPEKRQSCYDCLAPRLTFKAHPLETYVAIQKDLASASASRIEPFIVGKPVIREGLEAKAEHLIGLDLALQNARIRITQVCAKCTQEVTIFAANKIDALETLQGFGWKFQNNKAYCPNCTPPTIIDVQ